MEGKRITWIDCTKGMVILLVIVGHTITAGRLGSPVRGMIFSFHMPLFFAISSLTFHYSQNEREFIIKTKKAAKHLLLPIPVVKAIWTLWEILNDSTLIINCDYWKSTLLSLIVGSGTDYIIGGLTVPFLGSPWFLYALFFGRTLYDYLQLKLKEPQLPIMICVISLLGVVFGSSGRRMPFSLDIALAVLPFFWFGKELKAHENLTSFSLKTAVLFVVGWLITFWITSPVSDVRTYLDLAARRYPLHPICFICAGCGTVLFC